MEKGVRNHHALFQRTAWDSSLPTKKLRQHPSLITPMELDFEVALHEAVSTVPLPDPYTALKAYREFQPGSTYIGSIMNLMTAIDVAVRHPRCSRLEKDLGGLTIYALQLQIPFIREGQINQQVGT